MLGRYDRAMRARQPVGRLTLLQQAIAAIRRNNGALFYVPANFAGSWTDSAGTGPVNEIADVIGRMTDRTGGTGVATQATTANKPTVQTNAHGRYVMRFDGSNDSLTTNITTGNEGWVCAGVTFGGPVGNFETVFANGAGGPTQRGVWLVRPAADLIRMGVGNGTALTMPTITMLMGIPQVVEGGWTSTTVTVGLNGTTSSFARTGDATPAPYASLIGAYVPTVHFLNGPMTALVYCPSLPSAADRAIIRKLIGSLQGQSL